MKGVIYPPRKPPRRLHRFFIGYYVEENFDTQREAAARQRELKREGIVARRYTRERAMPESRLRNPEEL